MDVLGSLPINKTAELPEALSDISARVLTQYIEEDKLDDDPHEHRLERITRFAEMYFRYFEDVIRLHGEGGTEAIVNWQTEQNDVFYAHADAYQKLYNQVQHMANAPYHMTSWSLCFLVECTLRVCGVDGVEAYKAADKSTRDELEYVLRFGENLLQTFHSEQVVKGAGG